MVRALMGGTKTQTRRIVKPQPPMACHYVINDNQTAACCFGDQSTKASLWCVPPTARSKDHRLPCPYGQPGDRLWVRERWRVGAWFEDDGLICVDYYADGHSRREMLDVPDEEQFNRLWVQSSDDANKRFGKQERYKWQKGESPCRWRPSIHMPRWASRISLEITGVRVERLHDISEDDANAEGIEVCGVGGWRNYLWHGDHNAPAKTAEGWAHQFSNYHLNPVGSYSSLWESINGPGSWDANPWVWALTFRRLPNVTDHGPASACPVH
jgi:hypothetical protein